MEGNNYEIKKDYGAISNRLNPKNGDMTEVKLTKMSWFGREAKWDLRNHTNGEPKSGVVIGGDEALKRLRDLLVKVCTEIESEEEEY